ncbi:MAG: ribonuclease E inhibitor RraB [Flavobacteriales bacterium]|nr:ribonuclease E inhibitor RraB [Flavobacteriales bacterium]
MDEKEWALEHLRNDDPDRERVVTHWFYFARKEDMDRLIVEALDQGYNVDSSSKLEGKERPWGLVLTDTHSVDFDTLIAKHALLTRFAERFKGFYDGHEYAIEVSD